MLVHVEDITPGQYRDVRIPHITYDDLLRHDVVAVPVLMWYFRHTQKYDPTLTKLIGMAAGVGKARLSQAYNVCIERRYLVRIEFGISVPTGETGRAGQRYTTMAASRVPITDAVLDELVRSYTPGKFVIIPWGTPTPGQDREMRRVRVVNAEVYSYRGPQKVTRHPDTGETLVEQHAGRSGARAAKAARKPPEWTPSTAARAAEMRAAEQGPEPVTPKVDEPTSGVTCENTDAVQVAPEVDQPDSPGSTSIKKNHQQNPQVEDQGPASRGDASGAPDALRLSGPDDSAATGLGGPDPVDHLPGDHRNARAENVEGELRALEDLAASRRWTPPVPPAPHTRPLRGTGRRRTRREDLDPDQRARFRAAHEAATLRPDGAAIDGQGDGSATG